ncbi:unnamed protein product [Microthlaspi erraticum]|uniref:BED-type domain-containing protein n=1 Tax=Microthlaspi erraticum TaxID=1685480 RepID=A0A6D2KQ36_9BRAS|nr:unnamed protein product [Microthlaspi erraticum]
MDPTDGSNMPPSSIRQKQDIAWTYVTQSKDDRGRLVLTCGFCKKQNLGGGINRMKHHLAGQKGNVQTCRNVPPEVQHKMREALQANEEKRKEKQGLFGDVNLVGPDSEDVNVGDDHEGPSSRPFMSQSQKRKVSPNITSYFKGFNDPTQPTIKACMQSKEKIHDTDLSVALWFYDACLPMNAVNSQFYPIMVSKIASMGHGYVGPSYYALRVGLLRDANC